MFDVKDILLKLNVKEFGTHLSNYIDLYIKPLTVWRKIISNRSSSYNLTILHIFYYSIFVLIFINKPKSLISKYIVLEIIVTIIPFLVYLVPFKLFTQLFKKKVKWNRMFRLFLIFKLQFLPIIILLILFARWTKNESPYIIIENLAGLLWLFFIVILPLSLPLKKWQKILWIFNNYIFTILFSFGVFIFLKNINDLDFLEKISPNTPNQEYQIFNMKSPQSTYSIEDNYYLKIINNNKTSSQTENQFVSTELLNLYFSIYSKTELNDLKRQLDSMSLNIEKFTSLRKKINSEIRKDLELTNELKSSSNFKTNRKYFASINKYLIEYEKIFINKNIFNKLNKRNPKIIELKKDQFAILYEIDNSNLTELKNEYFKLEKGLDMRANKTHFLITKIFFPLEYLPEFSE